MEGVRLLDLGRPHAPAHPLLVYVLIGVYTACEVSTTMKGAKDSCL